MRKPVSIINGAIETDFVSGQPQEIAYVGGACELTIEACKWVEIGEQIKIYDYRTEIAEKAKKLQELRDNFIEGKEHYRKIKKLEDDIMDKFTDLPAEIEIKDDVIKLYNTDKEPKAGLHIHSFVYKHNCDYEVLDDNSYWSKWGISRSRTGMHGEGILVALCDDEHKIRLAVTGFQNGRDSEIVLGEQMIKRKANFYELVEKRYEHRRSGRVDKTIKRRSG